MRATGGRISLKPRARIRLAILTTGTLFITSRGHMLAVEGNKVSGHGMFHVFNTRYSGQETTLNTEDMVRRWPDLRVFKDRLACLVPQLLRDGFSTIEKLSRTPRWKLTQHNYPMVFCEIISPLPGDNDLQVRVRGSAGSERPLIGVVCFAGTAPPKQTGAVVYSLDGRVACMCEGMTAGSMCAVLGCCAIEAWDTQKPLMSDELLHSGRAYRAKPHQHTY